MFKNNYLYELPDDVQAIIYKNLFNYCIIDIEKDTNIKYLNRLYRATNNPNNTCVYSIIPKDMLSNDKNYKYKRIVDHQGGFTNLLMKDIIYLDRAHLIENTSDLHSNTISYYLYPLFTANKTLRKYLTIRFNLIKYYDKELIKNIIVVGDRADIIFTRNFRCNADIYYNIMVGYNVLYNSLSNITKKTLLCLTNLLRYLDGLKIIKY